MALPISVPVFWGTTMSSDRSTLVKRWPSEGALLLDFLFLLISEELLEGWVRL